MSNLKLADRQLQDLQQPRVSETLTIEKFQDWQVHIKDLEKEYASYVSRANVVLDQAPPASTLIERELNEVKNFWVGFNKSVQDYRDKMQLVANIRMQYKTVSRFYIYSTQIACKAIVWTKWYLRQYYYVKRFALDSK